VDYDAHSAVFARRTAGFNELVLKFPVSFSLELSITEMLDNGEYLLCLMYPDYRKYFLIYHSERALPFSAGILLYLAFINLQRMP
jgi:hypothetical protein